MPYLIRKVSDSDPKKVTCGAMRALTGAVDFKGMDIVHITVSSPTETHYHKELTECYFVLKGSIDMEIEGKIEHLDESSLIMIHPNTPHKAWKTSQEDAELLVICCPPWRREDEVLGE